MFWRRRPVPELTNAAYGRWLRAGRPPFELFLGLSELEQEALAALGDEHEAERILALADALRAAPGVDEETLALKMASKLLAKVRPPAAPPVEMPRETLAGFGARRTETHDVKGRKAPGALFGRAPDPQSIDVEFAP